MIINIVVLLGCEDAVKVRDNMDIEDDRNAVTDGETVTKTFENLNATQIMRRIFFISFTKSCDFVTLDDDFTRNRQ